MDKTRTKRQTDTHLPAAFKEMLADAFGKDVAEKAVSAMSEPSSAFIRLNPFKQAVPPPAFLERATPVEWSHWGYRLDERPVYTLHPLFHCGAYYVQDSSSMFVGEMLRRGMDGLDVGGRNVRALDLCAAPGGKTTDLTASLRESFGDRFIVVANEYVKSRCQILSDNLALWGEPNVVITNEDPKKFSDLEAFFDIMITDVPCSGEGMFRKDSTAVDDWSPELVAMCRDRQRKILRDVWKALRPGGLLLYSTCTFNRKENDLNALWIEEELGAENITPEMDYPGVLKTEKGYSLVPGLVDGEGQYCALFRKKQLESEAVFVPEDDASRCGAGCKSYGLTDASTAKANGAKQRKASLVKKNPKSGFRLSASFPDGAFRIEMRQQVVADIIRAVPLVILPEVEYIESAMRTVRAGVTAGQIKGNDIVPTSDMALSTAVSDDFWPDVKVDRSTALSYFHRDSITLPPDTPKGFVTLSFKDLKIGFVKNIGNRCNNLHPMSRRILMDIPK